MHRKGPFLFLNETLSVWSSSFSLLPRIGDFPDIHQDPFPLTLDAAAQPDFTFFGCVEKRRFNQEAQIKRGIP
jgi:hypothetical protein